MPETALEPTALALPDPIRIGGRPLSLTPELLADLSRLVAEGHYIQTACQALGVPRTNYYRWLRVGEADSEQGHTSPEAVFWHTLKTAEAQGEITVGRRWQLGGKDWPAYATWNERKNPERWAKRSDDTNGPKVIVQIGVRDSDVQVNVTSVSPAPTSLSPSLSDDMHRLTADNSGS